MLDPGAAEQAAGRIVVELQFSVVVQRQQRHRDVLRQCLQVAQCFLLLVSQFLEALNNIGEHLAEFFESRAHFLHAEALAEVGIARRIEKPCHFPVRAADEAP